MTMNCRHFSGYKPCALNDSCDSACPHFQEVRESVVFIHLGALGSVVRSTALIQALRTKHPFAKLTWVTDPIAAPLLLSVPGLDAVRTVSERDLLRLRSTQWDFAYVVDKCQVASGLVAELNPREIFGFCTDRYGAVIPANLEAVELYQIGLNNELKFKINRKSELQLIHEALALGTYLRNEYSLPLWASEEGEAECRKKKWSQGRSLVGINVGCSGAISAKKLSVDFTRAMIGELLLRQDLRVVLLGGGIEDERLAKAIARDLPIEISPMNGGLRDGLVSVRACDVVFSGDSLGMHMAISQKKFVIAWFGPTCEQEIDLFQRGVKVLSRASCAPCWKRSCDKEVMCYDQVSLSEVLEAFNLGLEWSRSQRFHSPEPEFSLFKRPFSEISF